MKNNKKYSEDFLCSTKIPAKEEMIKFINEQNITNMHWNKNATPTPFKAEELDDKSLKIMFLKIKKDIRNIYGIKSAADLKREKNQTHEEFEDNNQ